jgi:pimeloyl-ACP methyl ester carboxylesterase
MAIQGVNDEYGTMLQIDRIAELALGVELVKLAACRHSPHRDRPDDVIGAASRLFARQAAPDRAQRRLEIR